jgi:hypothetical protein
MPGHEVNFEKSERMFLSCVEKLEECLNIKVSNTSFCECITPKNQNCIHNKLRAGKPQGKLVTIKSTISFLFPKTP